MLIVLKNLHINLLNKTAELILKIKLNIFFYRKIFQLKDKDFSFNLSLQKISIILTQIQG